MVQRLAQKSALDLLCEVALAPGDAIVSELLANDLRIEKEKAAKRSGNGVLDLDEILQLTPKQLVKHFTHFESNELKRTFKHTCRLVPSECQYETTSFGSEDKSLREIKRHLQEHLEQLKTESTGRIIFTAETTVPIPRRVIESRQGKKSPVEASREKRSYIAHELVPQAPEAPDNHAASPERAYAQRSSPSERPSKRTPTRPKKRPVESPPPALVSPPERSQSRRRRTIEPPPPPAAVQPPAVSPAPPPPAPPSPPREQLREHDYARDSALESSAGPSADSAPTPPEPSVNPAESEAPTGAGTASQNHSAVPFESDLALLGLMEREVIGPGSDDGLGGGDSAESSDGVPLVGAEQVIRGGVMRSADLPVIMEGGSATVSGLRRYTRVVERDEYKQHRKPKGLAKFISQSEEDKEKARQALIEMRLRPSMCNNYVNYVCRVCFPPQRFTALSSLQSHYKCHLGIKDFSCKLCHKSFTRKTSLDCHMLIHEHKTRFRCSTCGHEFRQKSHYTEHLRRHTGETPYMCSVCGRGFKAKNSYRRHLESKHGQRLTNSGNIVILSDDEHRRLLERSHQENRSRRPRARPRSDDSQAPPSPSKMGFSYVDVVVRQSTGRVEYMSNVESIVPPPGRDVLEQVVDATVADGPGEKPTLAEQLLDPLPPLEILPPLQDWERELTPLDKFTPGAPSVANDRVQRPRINLTSSLGKYNVFYSSGNVSNNVRVVQK
ncbi:zinc finger protein Gfi-1-like [Amphibalanus amphitrite]|uniref:zinc finger protein Gfi-1-like n=1 Tax=Amphibalanus amphitrite TaxID=1232801 RepID=UPI001C913D00|nr:zinc finger protein Gfi-1-like [Amphibalanus amphitrite]